MHNYLILKAYSVFLLSFLVAIALYSISVVEKTFDKLIIAGVTVLASLIVFGYLYFIKKTIVKDDS